jgi:hypothetical protein
MTRRLPDGLGNPTPYNVQDGWDLNDLLHPAQAFEHPSDVVYDPDLTLNEKRAILASWASDACAPEASPHLRSPPGAKQSVLFDDVMEALRTLDKEVNAKDSAHYRRLLRRGHLEQRPRPSSTEKRSINWGSASAWKSFGGNDMWPDRYIFSKFIALTGFILSFAVILAAMAK